MSDDERRHVAERLRAYGKEFGDPTWRDLCNVVFWDDDSYPTAVRKLHLIDRLADLIEPSCDRDALLRLADEIDRKSNDGTVNPDPMRPLATSLDLFGYARRIREALGVES